MDEKDKNKQDKRLQKEQKRPRWEKNILTEILRNKWRAIWNAQSVKKMHLQELKKEKNQNHITVQQYYQVWPQNPTSTVKPTWGWCWLFNAW